MSQKNAAQSDETFAHHTPAQHVFKQMSTELSFLHKISEVLQIEISEMLPGPHDRSETSIHALQSLDLLTQSLMDLETLFRTLEALTPPEQTLAIQQATKKLKLSDLAARFNSGIHATTHPIRSSGDCELF